MTMRSSAVSVALGAAILTSVGSGMYAIRSVAAPGDPVTAKLAAVRDGSHDFDFIYGKWRMPNHRLKKRLEGSNEWDDFITCDVGTALPGGIGDTDYWKASYWKDFVGVAIRTYEPKSGLWRIYWVDNTFSAGVMGPPVVGKFDGNVGKFEGSDTSNGVPVLVRFTWTLNPTPAQTSAKWERTANPAGAKVVAKWEQAFSTDGGKTWETNWYNEFIHDDNCTPTS
jgi:hypothetical protein